MTVICTKQSAFDIQFHLIVAPNFLKACVKDHGDTYRGALVRGNVNISVYFNKLENNF